MTIGVAAIVVGIGVARIELDRLGEIGQGASVIVLVLVRIAAVVKGNREVSASRGRTG